MSMTSVRWGLSWGLIVAATLHSGVAVAQNTTDPTRQLLERYIENQRHTIDVLERRIDNLMLFERLRDVADVDVVNFTGPPPAHESNPTAQGAGNPLILTAYTFVPKQLNRKQPQPLIVLVHGGVHSNFASGSANVVRELVTQGYTVIAPDYRGSTGYGRGFYEQIDYGGLEIEDSYAARKFALETMPWLDSKRVGIVGWSHGGLHALLNIFKYPDDYAVAYAGVPVSDLIARMGYKTQGYRDQFAADYHLGKDAYENVAEYRKRSPSWQTDKYRGTPLLIHTNTNDQDVNVLEVERLIQALKASGKSGFEYKIYQAAPGGHSFNRLDTPLAKQSRREVYEFLARHLRPARALAYD